MNVSRKGHREASYGVEGSMSCLNLHQYQVVTLPCTFPRCYHRGKLGEGDTGSQVYYFLQLHVNP